MKRNQYQGNEFSQNPEMIKALKGYAVRFLMDAKDKGDLSDDNIKKVLNGCVSSLKDDWIPAIRKFILDTKI